MEMRYIEKIKTISFFLLSLPSSISRRHWPTLGRVFLFRRASQISKFPISVEMKFFPVSFLCSATHWLVALRVQHQKRVITFFIIIFERLLQKKKCFFRDFLLVFCWNLSIEFARRNYQQIENFFAKFLTLKKFHNDDLSWAQHYTHTRNSHLASHEHVRFFAIIEKLSTLSSRVCVTQTTEK